MARPLFPNSKPRPTQRTALQAEILRARTPLEKQQKLLELQKYRAPQRQVIEQQVTEERELTDEEKQQIREYVKGTKESTLNRIENWRIIFKNIQYKNALQNEGFTVTVNEDGTLNIQKPSDMSTVEATYLQIKLAPSDAKFTITKDGKTEEVPKSEALEIAEQAYERERFGDIEQARQQADQLSVFGLIAQALTRPEVGGALLRETKEKFEYKWAELSGAPPEQVQRELEEAQQAEIARYEAQGAITQEWQEVEQQGTPEAYLEFFKEEITLGVQIAASFGISAVVGRAAPLLSSTLAAKNITTIGKIPLSAISKIATFGLLAVPIATNVIPQIQTIVTSQENIDKTTDPDLIEQYEQQKWTAVGSLLNSAFEYTAMARVGVAGYKYGYSRGVQAEFLKNFPKGSVEREFVRRGFKSTRALSKVKSKFKFESVKPKEVSWENFRTAEQLLKSRKDLVLSGSGASQRQVAGARAPADYDIYVLKDSQIPKVKSILGGKEAGFDIHGAEMYSPGMYHRQGWFMMKPTKVGGIKMISPGEQLFRKFQGATEYLAGTTHPGRVKDIPDFFTTFQSQLSSAKSSWNPITRIKASYAESLMKPYFTGGVKLQAITYPGSFTLTPPTTPTITPPTQPSTVTPSSYVSPTSYTAPTMVYPKPSTYKAPQTISYTVTPTPKITSTSYKAPTIPSIKPIPSVYSKPKKIPIKETFTVKTTPYAAPEQPKAQPKSFYAPRISFEEPKKQPKKKQAYNVYSNGMKINYAPLNRQQALGKGAAHADKTSATSFSIKKTTGTPINQPQHSNTWKSISFKFTKSGNTYKEKKKYQKDFDIEKGTYKPIKFGGL